MSLLQPAPIIPVVEPPTLDTAVIAQTACKALVPVVSSDTAIPAGCGSHRFEPQAADAAWNAGLVVQVAFEYSRGGSVVYTSGAVNVAPHDPSTTGVSAPPHACLNHNFDPRIGKYVLVLWGDPAIDTAPDPRAIAVDDCTVKIKIIPSHDTTLAGRFTAAPTNDLLPTSIAMPVITDPQATASLQTQGAASLATAGAA